MTLTILPPRLGSELRELHVGLQYPFREVRELLATAVSDFGVAHPEIPVVYDHFDSSDPTCGLASGAVDVALVHLPITPFIDYLLLDHHQFFVALASSHPLSRVEALWPEALRGERLALASSKDVVWNNEVAKLVRRIDPESIMDRFDEMQRHAAVHYGLAFGLKVWSPHEAEPVSSISLVPLLDVEWIPYVLAWRPGALSPAGRDFVDVVRRLRGASVAPVRLVR